MYRYEAIAVFSILMAACGNSGSEEQPAALTSFESLHVSLSGTPATLSLSAEPPEGCTVQMPLGGDDDAICVTPLEVSGWASGIHLLEESQTDSTVTTDSSFRVKGLGVGLKRTGEWEGEEFDLSKAESVRTVSNLEENYINKVTFDRLSIELRYLRFKAFINSEYWNVIIPFYSQNVEQNDIVQSCQYDEVVLQSIATNANLLTELEFEKGDFLFCVKSTNSDCELSEFQFFDTTTSQFTDIRPDTPKLSQVIKEAEAGCAPSTDPLELPKLQWGSYNLVTSITGIDSFSLYADYSYGEDSRGNPNGTPATGDGGGEIPPFKNYVYTASGQTQEGNDLNVAIQLDTKNFIFLKDIENGDQLDAASTGDIARAFSFQSLHQSEQDSSGVNLMPAMNASMTVTLTEKLPSQLTLP